MGNSWLEFTKVSGFSFEVEYVGFILFTLLRIYIVYEEEQSQGYNRRTMYSFTKFS